MGIQIPPVLVLIVCKTVLAGPPDQNAAYTKWENLEWATQHSMMVCRRNEIQLYDPVEGVKLLRTTTRRRRSIRISPSPRNARGPESGLPPIGTSPTATRLGACGGSAARRRSWICGPAT